ncbi:MAG: MaoC family dehydratase [Chloroflexota bacterium]
MTLKAYRYEAIEIGEEFGPVELVVDDHLIRAYSFAGDDYNPWYFSDTTPFRRRIAPPVPVANEVGEMYLTKFDITTASGLHQKEDIWFLAPIPLGAHLTLTGRVVEKYVRRGKGYAVSEGEARDETGRVLLRRRGVGLVEILPDMPLGTGSGEPTGRRVTGQWPSDRPVVAKASEDVTEGSPIKPLTKRLYQDQMSVYSGAGKHWRDFHTDLEMALKAGFSTTIGQGMMETTWCNQMLTDFFGPSWHTTGWLSTAYLRPIFCGETIVCRGVVNSFTDEPRGRKIELDIWCENQDGAMTAAGYASAVAVR